MRAMIFDITQYLEEIRRPVLPCFGTMSDAVCLDHLVDDVLSYALNPIPFTKSVAIRSYVDVGVAPDLASDHLDNIASALDEYVFGPVRADVPVDTHVFSYRFVAPTEVLVYAKLKDDHRDQLPLNKLLKNLGFS